MYLVLICIVVVVVRNDIDVVCDRIVFMWLLDRFIVVNLYWGWRDSSIIEVVA